MKPLISAIRTLTIIPIPGKDTENFGSAIPFFPIAATILGSIPVSIFYLFEYFNSSQWGIAALIALFISTALTGFLHVDGLGDVADAFGGGKTKEAILKILKDSRMGTFGICAIVFDLLFKLYLWEWAFKNKYSLTILFSFILARISQMIFLNHMRSARTDGIASSFINTTNKFRIFSFISIIAFITPFYFIINKTSFFLSIIVFLIILVINAQYFNKKLNGITGDCLGTINEITEITVLFSIFIVSSLL